VLATGTLIALLAGLVALLLLVLAPVSAPGRAAKLLGRGCENRILRARTMAKWGWASVSRCNEVVIRCYRVERARSERRSGAMDGVRRRTPAKKLRRGVRAWKKASVGG
jgi:hypothetical protein